MKTASTKCQSKKLVIFCKTFLPEFTPESIRTAALIKYWIRDGWKIYLFTWSSGNIIESRYNYLNTIQLFRIDPLKSLPIPILSYLLNYLYLILITTRQIARTVRSSKISYMFVSIPQLQPLIIGALVKLRIKKIKLVEEVRDLYSISELVAKNKIRFWLLYFLERGLMKNVDALIYVTRIIKDEYIKYFGKTNSKIREGMVILNGFDPEDMDEIDSHKRSIMHNNTITFCYTGRLYDSRNLDKFLEGIGLVIKKNPEWLKRICVQIVGDISHGNRITLESVIRQYQLNEIVQFLGQRPHNECINFQRLASFNILATHTNGSYYAIPSKIFEYIAAGEPIIALTTDQLVIDLIKKYNLGYCISNDLNEISQKLSEILNERKVNYKNNITSIPKEFRRDYQSEIIADFICSNQIAN